MPTTSNRRTFLRQGAGLVLGLSFLDDAVGQERREVSVPEALSATLILQAARERMRRDVRPGLVIVVPEDAAARQRLADELGVLLGGHASNRTERSRIPPPASRAPGIDVLLAEAVVVCLPAAFARAAFPEMTPPAAVVLLSPSGTRVADLEGDPTLFQADAVRRLSAFLHGPEDRRLEETARLQREALGREMALRVETAVTDLASSSYRERETASALLQTHAPRLTAVLVQATRRSHSLEAKRRIERLLAGVLRPADAPEALPFGVAFERQHFDSCPGCGRGFVSAESAQFLRLLRFTLEPRR